MSAALHLAETAAVVYPDGFAASEQYGGPLQAALAMQLVASGVVPRLPDVHYVNAFARQVRSNSPGDIESVLGPACSYSDRGCDVLMLGKPRVLAATPKWLDTLRERSQVKLSEGLPTALKIKALLADNWSVLLHAKGGAFKSPETSVHPVLVVGTSGDEFVVHNPGSGEIDPFPVQRILAALALGTLDEPNHDRVSLLAVRLP